MSDIRRRTVAGLVVGDTFTLTRTFGSDEVEAFAALTRDYNPIHFSRRFVQRKGFTSRICHGLLVGAMITEVGGQIGWLASGMSFRFKKPVFIGDTISCRFTLTAVGADHRATAEAVLTNQDEQVVMQASLFGVLPDRGDRALLADLLDTRA
jgi:acyl dehydratase